MQQKKKSKGNILKKKTTVTITAHVKPEWWLAAPAEMLPSGQLMAICVGPEAISNPNAGCSDLNRVATSGVLLKPWNGGGLPSNEEMLYEYKKSQEGFTVLAFTLLAFVVGAGAIGLLSGAGGVGVAMSTSTGLSTMQAGAIAAGANLLGATMLGDGQLDSVQRGLLGGISSGKLNVTHDNKQSAGAAQGVYNRFILPDIYKGAIHDSVQTWFGVKCPLNKTVAQCKNDGQDPGIGWRTDSFGIEQTVKRMTENMERCKRNASLSASELNKCAAPGGSALLLKP